MSEYIVVDNVERDIDWNHDLKKAIASFEEASSHYAARPEEDASIWLAEVKKIGFWHADEKEVPIEWVVKDIIPQLTCEQEKIFDWMMGQIKEIREYDFLPCGVIGELVKGGHTVTTEVTIAWVHLSEREKQEVLRKFLLMIT